MNKRLPAMLGYRWQGGRLQSSETVHEVRIPKRVHKRCQERDTTCGLADWEQQGPLTRVPHSEVNCRHCLKNSPVIRATLPPDSETTP